MLGRGRYCLGAGGKDPVAADPFGRCAKPEKHTHDGERVFCDCSGFVAWCIGKPRKLDGYGWIYTDQLVKDAARDLGPHDLGVSVPKVEAMVGDIVVYGSVDTDGDGDRDLIGHVGIISWVRPGGVRTLGDVRVIHCQARGDVAVVETDGRIWERRGVVLRLHPIDG